MKIQNKKTLGRNVPSYVARNDSNSTRPKRAKIHEIITVDGACPSPPQILYYCVK